jgi:hypothetical protein
MNAKRSYSFKEGLAMMAVKDIGVDPYLAAEAGEDARSIIAALRRAKTAKGQEKAKHIAAAQTELRKLSPQQHGKLINALQAKVLALQGRGGDTAVAHLEPGEMVVPRAMLTPQLAQLIAAEAAKRGIDPKQLIVGNRNASINPVTGAEEFGFFEDLKNKVSGWFKTEPALDMTGVETLKVTKRQPSLIEPIEVTATKRVEGLGWKERWGETEPNVVTQRIFNDFNNPNGTSEDRAAIEYAARKRLLENPEATLNPKHLPSSNDLGMLQDIHPDDLSRGTVANVKAQNRWLGGKGYETDFQYIGPDNSVRWRTGNIRTNPSSAGSLLSTFEKQLQDDRWKAKKRSLKEFPSDMINPWDGPNPNAQ